MVLDITQVLNEWAAQGVFSYLFPFLIIFAVVFAILQKTRLFGDATGTNANKNVAGINAIIAVSIGLLSLLNDQVPTFFAVLFPKFGIALSIFLVLLILLGFVGNGHTKAGWVGWVLGVGVILWAWSEWEDMFGGSFAFTNFLDQYFWGLVLLVAIAGLIYFIVKGDSGGSTPPRTV
ncbi:MAG: hypothetical protein WCI72_03715 [archaeon]